MDAITREEYLDILADLKEQRTLLRASIRSALENAEIQTYSMTDPEGGQSATRRDPAALRAELEDINRKIGFYTRLLDDRLSVFRPRRW